MPRYFNAVQWKTIWETGSIMGVHVCKFYNQLKPQGPSTTCGSCLSARRMRRFEPARKPRGSQGSRPVEAESRLPRGSCEVTPETASEMLRTANQLLQVALQLLQQGPAVQGRRVESAKVGVNCVSVACQTDGVDKKPEDSVESEETAVPGASWGVALWRPSQDSRGGPVK